MKLPYRNLSLSAKRKVQIFITTIGVMGGLAHLFFPLLKIDAITVTLLIVAIIPWLEPLLKSVELPGGIKMEFQQLEKVGEEAKQVGIIKEKDIEVLPEQIVEKEKYAFVEIAPINQQLALVGLRIEIEKRIRLLAEKYSIDARVPSLSILMTRLKNADILSSKEASVFSDMIYTLNRAAHGVEYDPRNADWIMINGPEILESLDSKLEVRGGRFSIGRSDEKEHWIDKSYNECKKETTLAWNMCISKHAKLWEKELENIYNSLIKKLKSPQLEKLIESQANWQKQRELDQRFITSFDDLGLKIGSGGKAVIGLNFMNKIRERTLELEEVLNMFI